MILTTIDSTAIHAVGYDKEQQELQIIFTGGGIYSYRDVPEWVFHGLLNAISPGAYFQANVRGKFDNQRLGRFRRRWQRGQAPSASSPKRAGRKAGAE